MKKILMGLFCLCLPFFACETSLDDKNHEPEKDSLFSANNSTDGELEDIPTKYIRQDSGTGIVGNWKYEYQSKTNGEVTGRTIYEIQFKDSGGFSRTTSGLRRRVIEYIDYEPVYGWERLGLPVIDSGSFTVETVENEKKINVKKYNFDNDSYMMIYENANIYVSEHYLYIGNKNEAPHGIVNTLEVSNISQHQDGDNIIISWENPVDDEFDYIEIHRYRYENDVSTYIDIKNGLSSYTVTNMGLVDYITIKTIDIYTNRSNGTTYHIQYLENVSNVSALLLFNSINLKWTDPTYETFDHVVIGATGMTNSISVPKGIQQCDIPIAFNTNSNVGISIKTADVHNNVSRTIGLSNNRTYMYKGNDNNDGVIGLACDSNGNYLSTFPLTHKTAFTSFGYQVTEGVNYYVIDNDNGITISEDGVVSINDSINFPETGKTFYVSAHYDNVIYILPIRVYKYQRPTI
jgi:hypothetical protein